MTWRPLVTDDVPRIRTAIATLVATVDATPRASIEAHVDRAVLYAYLAADGLASEAAGGLDTALGLVTGVDALYGGAAHVGWGLAHLADGEDVEAACAAIDARIAGRIPHHGFDVISGLAGFAVYALERGDRGRELAAAIVAGLAATAVRHPTGVAWFTPAEQVPPNQRANAPDGYWNLGVAHGTPGVIAALARLAAANVGGARPMLDDAVAYVRAIAPVATGPRFPPWLPYEGPFSKQIAWCYGDLGVAHALLGAGLYCEEPAWRDEGIALARACAARASKDSIMDAAICHGFAGVAHLFGRMALATGDAVLADAARTWLHELVTAVESAQPTDPTLLEGAAGMALVLAAATSELEPLWDRLLLVDLPS